MGAEVLSCYKCQRRLTEADFGRGEAMKVGSLSTCADCAEELLARLTPEQRRAALAKAEAAMAAAEDGAEPPPATRTTRHAAGPRATASLRTGGRPEPEPSARPPAARIAAIAAGVLVLLLALVALRGRSPEPTSPSDRPGPPRPEYRPPRPPASDPAPDAKRLELQALVADVTVLEKEIRALAGAEEYRKALDRLAAARSSRHDPEWETVVVRLEKEVRGAADDRYRPVEARAVEARRTGASVKAYRETVARWNIPEQVEALQKALQAVPPPVPSDGLALRLRLDETSGTAVADATGGPPGRILGQAAWKPGRYGNALRFNGIDTRIRFDDRPPLNPGRAMTIAVWIRADDWLGNYRIAQKGAADNQFRLTRETKPSTGMLFDIKNVGSVTARLPDTDGWHHLAATFDGKALRIYWDGVRAAESPASGTIPRTPDALCIGTKREGAPAGDYFKGLMDELLIYSRALTETEIAALSSPD
jgi:hypothetical protein